MSGLFFNLGRSLGRAIVPAIRKSKWVWHTMSGTEADALRAETEFGRALAVETRATLGLPDDSPDAALVDKIARRLAACVRNKARTFKVQLFRSDEPNAMALPGGFIFVGLPLVDLCQRDPNELAFVVAHEMAHVVRGHVFNRLVTRVGLNAILTIASRGASRHWLSRTGLQLLQSAHSQDHEFEADEWGVSLAQAAGYDPKAAIRLFQRLQSLRQIPTDLGAYFKSHPPEAERIQQLQTVLNTRKIGS